MMAVAAGLRARRVRGLRTVSIRALSDERTELFRRDEQFGS